MELARNVWFCSPNLYFLSCSLPSGVLFLLQCLEMHGAQWVLPAHVHGWFPSTQSLRADSLIGLWKAVSASMSEEAESVSQPCDLTTSVNVAQYEAHVPYAGNMLYACTCIQ